MKMYFTPKEMKENEALLDELLDEIQLESDESGWDGTHYDMKRRIFAEDLPASIKMSLQQHFYDEEVADSKIDEDLGIMQLLTLHFDEEGKNYYLLNGGYYIYGRNGWDVEQYFDFVPTDASSAWMNELVRDFNRIGWQTNAV